MRRAFTRSVFGALLAVNIVEAQTGNTTVPISIVNSCNETIWPGIVNQGGEGTQDTGFSLSSGANHTVYVSNDWAGRVWGRTNCSFSNGQSQGQCTTGECGQLVCKQAGNPPATLAEFTFSGSHDLTFYDISLVDGYNLPLAIVMIAEGNTKLTGLNPGKTNPSCVASVSDLAAAPFNPYSNNQVFLGTNSSYPLTFETKQTNSSVSSWCPWDLQVNPPTAPGDGVYPYPDGDVARPAFDPCLSACAKYNSPEYCCTGQYDGSGKCSPNYYSKAAKSVCPDAYSYAYDDQSSTFSVPTGGGFQVVFCPGGRSTNILSAS